ncbi:short-chain dehydrogenase [Rhodobacteraceae bacterium WD3A24]|nr:short-chain dehydrogenase [Rhodobacteraceae bacterium WD3A24]
MTTTAERIRAWRGPGLLTYGFRPFFLGAALWAVIVMGLWLAMLGGSLALPTAFDPLAWHAHEFLFGYLAAAAAGFLLTAVPNWTGRLPIVGWPLGALFSLWIAGRVAIAWSAGLSPLVVAAIDLAMPVALGAVLAREIIAGRNWRNLIVLAMLGVFALGNAIFHWEAARGAYAAQGYGLRLGLGAGVMMIAVIGGRIVPSFTRNWLVKRGGGGRPPTPPMQRFDRLALALLLAALLVWLARPEAAATGLALLVAGIAHAARLVRWAGERTGPEPLVWVLHAGYGFVPLGALALGATILLGGPWGAPVAQHLWMAGAVGLMTLAVMTRATLGHSGRSLTAGAGTTAIYVALLLAVVARILAGIWPGSAMVLHSVSGMAWLAAFGGFALLYGPLLLRAKARG